MPTEVFSVKVSDELKNRLKALMDESGLPGQGFMEQIIHVYELSTARDLMPSAAGDIAELQAITRRMNDIFIHMIEQNVNLMAERDNTHNEELEKKDRAITDLQVQLQDALAKAERLSQEKETLHKQYQELQEELNQSEKRMQEQERSYQNLLESKEELIKEYRGKNDTLTGIVQEYTTYRDQNKELITSIEILNTEIATLQKQISEKEQSEVSIRAEMERMVSQHEVALLKGQMEQERATLALRERHQSRIEEIAHEHQTQIDEYNGRVRELLEQIESIRSSRRSSKEKSLDSGNNSD